MNIKHLSLTLCAVAITTVTAQQSPPPQKDDMADCPMHAEHTAAGVNERGDKGMGFSHMKTAHHFRIFSDGGAIEVTTNDAADEGSREQIRGHLAQIAKAFTAGNFETPMFVHAQMPSGAAVMQQMKTNIRYSYEQLEAGARVRISTADPKALAAVHEFLRFQIKEHRTGDPLEIATQ